jgi:putative oxidoreductase
MNTKNQNSPKTIKMKNKILFVVSLLFGLLFINAGLNKFFEYMPMPENIPEEALRDFRAMKEIIWLMPLLGLAEIIGGLLIIFPQKRALGAVILFPIVVGIMLTHLFVDMSGLPIAIIVAAVLGWIIYENRDAYEPL